MFTTEFEKVAGALQLAEKATDQTKSLFSNQVKPLLNRKNPVKMKMPKINSAPVGGK